MSRAPGVIGGFSEAGVVVRDLAAWTALLRDIAGWEMLAEGALDDGWKRLWGVPAAETARERLLGRAGSDKGHVRLFAFDGRERPEARGGTRAWDPGGHFDLDVRVTDMVAAREAVTRGGFRGVSPAPVRWRFGDLDVREWLVTGPESVVLALIERLRPPPDPAPPATGFSGVFNASQIVADMGAALDFYARLGFRTVVRHTGPLADGGGQVLGLAPDEAERTPVDLAILHPAGVVDGSVELVAFPGRDGRHAGPGARPDHRGINVLRFPVQDLPGFSDRLAHDGIAMEPPGIVEARLAPHGAVRALAVRSPDGAWLEFYEPRRG